MGYHVRLTWPGPFGDLGKAIVYLVDPADRSAGGYAHAVDRGNSTTYPTADAATAASRLYLASTRWPPSRVEVVVAGEAPDRHIPVGWCSDRAYTADAPAEIVAAVR